MSKWYTFHIKNEILFWFLLLALFPLIALTALNYSYQKSIYQEQALDQLERLLEDKIHDINQNINHISKELILLSKVPLVKTALQQYSDTFEAHRQFNLEMPGYETFFNRILTENRFYDIFLVNLNGDIVYTVIKEPDLGTNLNTGRYAHSNLGHTVRNSYELLNVEFSDFAYYEPSKEEAAFVATPIYGNNKVMGFLAVQIAKDRLSSPLTLYSGLGQTGEYVAASFDDSGQAVSTIPLRHMEPSTQPTFKFKPSSEQPIIKALQGNKGKGITKDYRGHPVIAAWSYLPTLRWGIVAKIDESEVLEPVAKLGFYSILLLFFIGLGIVIAILMSIRHIVEPIERLTQGVQQFANGSIETQVQIDVQNEIGELSKNFNDMASSLMTSQETIHRYANELEDEVKERTQELESAQAELQQTNKELNDFFDVIDQYIITSTTDKNGTIIKVSQAFSDITDYTKQELIGKNHNLIRHPDTASELFQDLWQTITQGKTWSGEIKNQRKDGSYYWLFSTISPIVNEQQDITGYTSISQEITDKKKVELLSVTDQLTKLFNRRKIETLIEQELACSERYQRPFSLAIIDIDHFKQINDTYGHDLGDQVLIEFSQILKNHTRKTDSVARWGGEEFMLIATEATTKEILAASEILRQALERHHFPQVGQVTASFGISEHQDNDTAISLIKRADIALYQAKENGRNQVVYYQETPTGSK